MLISSHEQAVGCPWCRHVAWRALQNSKQQGKDTCSIAVIWSDHPSSWQPQSGVLNTITVIKEIIIIAVKGTIRDFLNLLTAPRTVSNTYAQVARAQSCANHMQHIKQSSHATCCVTCHVVRRDSSAIKYDRVEAKANWKLAIMKKLAGTTWGANSDILKQVYTGAVRPALEYASTTWDTASKTNKSKLDRVLNMGLRMILGALRSTPIQHWKRLQTFGVQMWVQSCHPRGKAEETDQSSTPLETSAWNQKPPEKKELQAQVEGSAKRKHWSSGGRSRKMWGTHNVCLGITEEPSRSQNWNSRPCSKGNTGSRTAESNHTGDDAGSLSQEHLDPCLHRWLCRECC